MTQTLTNSILAAKARATETPTQDDGSAEAKVQTHWDKERERRSNDPKNQQLADAITLSKAQTSEWFAALHDRKNPNHEANLAAWKDKYGMDSKKVEADITKKLCDKWGAAPFEMEDPSYTKMVFEKYKPLDYNATRESVAAHENFKQALNEKWDAKGYKGDKAFVAALAEKYSLKPNNHLQKYQEFEEKE